MVLSAAVFFIIYAATIVVGTAVALVLIVGWKDLWMKKTLASAKYNIIYLIILVAFPTLILQSRSLVNPTNEIFYTNWIFQLSGEAIRIIQERLNYGLIQDFFIVVYVWVFTFIVYFSPVLLLARDDRATLRRYAITMMLNYLILIPFYMLFPVAVSGSTPGSGMTPFLYVSTYWGRMVTSVDPLNNDFPSGHVSLMVATFLVFYFAGTQYRRYYYFLVAATIAISFAVLYLGIHWPPDVFAGFAIGVATAAASGIPRIQMTIDRYVRMLTVRIVGGRETPLKPPG